MFGEVEAVVRPDCVLATNTSSLSVTDMAAGPAHPSRVVVPLLQPGGHMPLVEVVRGAATVDAALATALAVGKALKKNCVLVPAVIPGGCPPDLPSRGAGSSP